MNAPLRPLVIVNSGAYAEQELVAEFGALPPAMFPVGATRLYELQARALQDIQGDKVLTLPESFELAPWDEERLAALGFTVLRTPDELGLGAALLYALGSIGFSNRPLKILHGDTLVSGIDFKADDIVAVADGRDGYRWASVTLNADHTVGMIRRPIASSPVTGPRLCGYFAFANLSDFAAKLAVSDGDFYAALNSLTAAAPLKGVRPGSWLDFGHVQTYFKSRRIVTTQRSFNMLQIGDMEVRKSSASAAPKLRAEARWLREIPPPLAPFCARVLDEGATADGYFYDTEYEYMPTLAELYIFGRMPLTSWSRILESCASFINASGRVPTNADISGTLYRLVVDKTAERLERYAHTADMDLDADLTLNGRPAPSLRDCLRAIEESLLRCGDVPSVMHGDFCFSNILYNFRTERVRLIDPRGLNEFGEFTLHGDRRYDLAKLMHSICGRYDLIIAGHVHSRRTGDRDFELAFPQSPGRLEVEAIAKASTMGGVRLGSPVVWAAMTSLFLSMPPLHGDRPDRQAAFIANALRLHQEREYLS